ncbi:hypothetical protein HDU98_010485 [Podochytrium sp. JEL0797]|nr:hypothetical protein HDU98_010485 [Podochytrium sp. JEL0797]
MENADRDLRGPPDPRTVGFEAHLKSAQADFSIESFAVCIVAKGKVVFVKVSRQPSNLEAPPALPPRSRAQSSATASSAPAPYAEPTLLPPGYTAPPPLDKSRDQDPQAVVASRRTSRQTPTSSGSAISPPPQYNTVATLDKLLVRKDSQPAAADEDDEDVNASMEEIGKDMDCVASDRSMAPLKSPIARADGGKINTQIPTAEKPILQSLYRFRQSLAQLRKESHDALTLADINAKGAELADIVQTLETVRHSSTTHEIDPNEPLNLVDAVLDQAWMSMFALWSKIGGVDGSVYPTYVSLVSLARSAEALRASEAWTAEEVESLSERLRVLDESVAAAEGKFVATEIVNAAGLGDKVPSGQAIMTSLLNRVHRVVALMNADIDSVASDLVPLQTELEGFLKQLSGMPKTEYSMDSLAVISKRLHAIDAGRGATGNFRGTESKAGQATVSGTLNACFDKLNLLVANLDPVTDSSPLYESYRSLLTIHSELATMLNNTQLRSNLKSLSTALAFVQSKLQDLELQRVDGAFVPSGSTFEVAVKLPGQATMHKLLHDCHAKISKLVEPISVPVGEALLPTYELLFKQRTRLRKLRTWASAGWNVREDLSKVQEVLKSVDATKIKGLYAGNRLSSYHDSLTSGIPFASAFSHPTAADAVYFPQVPNGQATVAALADECDSLVWCINCML